MLVFAGGEDEARAAATPLRNVLWGDHRISVLLPSGEEPIKARLVTRNNGASCDSASTVWAAPSWAAILSRMHASCPTS